MSYNSFFEMGALLVLSVLLVRYYLLRRFPDRASRIFGMYMVTGILDISLDILGCFIIDHINSVPVRITLLVNNAFYMMQSILPLMLLAYVAFSNHAIYNSTKKAKYLLVLPSAVFCLLVLLNPALHLFSNVVGEMGQLVFVSGKGPILLYASTLFYLLIINIFALRHRKKMEPVNFRTIVSYTVLLLITMGIQFMIPDVLMTGTGIMLTILLMNFSLQDPAMMLDSNTNLFNFRAMERYLEDSAIHKTKLYISIVCLENLIDLSGTISVWALNDLCITIGKRLEAIVKDKGWAFSMLTDRFALVCENESDALSVQEALQELFSDAWATERYSILFTATIRNCVTDGEQTPSDIVNLINIAFTEVDDGTRGKMLPIDGKCLERGRHRLRLEEAIRSAIKNDSGFTLRFQPIYDMRKKAFTRAEVLLRLETDDLGVVFPNEFMPIVKAMGLMGEIDNLVVDRTCRFFYYHPELKEFGLDRISLNLSAPDSFYAARNTVKEIVSRWLVKPSQLIFEMTETVTLSNYLTVAELMTEMSEEGFAFALDDFGTGYANIMEMQSLPFRSVKLDRSILSADNKAGRIVLNDLTTMLHSIGKIIVMEGVETKEQLDYVNSLGIEFVQGFYFSKPMRELEFMEFLKEKNG